MSEVKTNRPFQERFLDGYDRAQLRLEVQKVKRSRFGSLRRGYATLALGASLALGSLGIPLKVGHFLQSADTTAQRGPEPAAAPDQAKPATAQIAGDLQAAKQIAAQVAGGVTGAAAEVAGGVTGAVQDVARTVSSAPAQIARAPQQLADAAEAVKQQFFQKQVPFGSIIYSEAKRNDLSPELVAAVVHTESKFDPTARSNRGAVGLMQLVPRTGRWLGATNLNDPVQNITAGAKYLKYLNDRFGGDQQKVVAAYNAGEGNVRRFNGVPPFQETRNYVQRVKAFAQDLGAQQQTADAGVGQ